MGRAARMGGGSPRPAALLLWTLAAALLLEASLGGKHPGVGGRPAGKNRNPKRKKKSQRVAKPPGFDCEVPEWAPPKPEETAEIDLGDYCDFDQLDEPPTDEEFLAKYWRQRPVIIHNYTARWPASAKWHKRFLWEEYGGREVDTFDSDSYMVSHGKWVPTRLADWVRDKLCTPTTLSYDGQMHQEYVFDKDGLFSRVPELLEDYDHPSFITQFFDAELHERFSRYFLVGSSMSGINYHSHTDAYNGLVHGRKRWLVYDHKQMMDPPYRSHGTLRWVREILPGMPEDQKPMQCMQSAGDLIYVPEGYWHGTVNLGETIGVSGQFVRNTGKWAQQASEAVGEGRWDDAAELYRLMVTTLGPHDKDARFNRALALAKAGPSRREDTAEAVEDFLAHWGAASGQGTEQSRQESEVKANAVLEMAGVAPGGPRGVGGPRQDSRQLP